MDDLETRLVMDAPGPYTLRGRYLAGKPIKVVPGRSVCMPWSAA